jgi:hypothetical protein
MIMRQKQYRNEPCWFRLKSAENGRPYRIKAQRCGMHRPASGHHARQVPAATRPISLNLATVVATSIAFLPNLSSLVTISTSSCSSLFSSLMKPGRCSIAELPDTVSETTRRGFTLNPAASDLLDLVLGGSDPSWRPDVSEGARHAGIPVQNRCPLEVQNRCPLESRCPNSSKLYFGHVCDDCPQTFVFGQGYLRARRPAIHPNVAIAGNELVAATRTAFDKTTNVEKASFPAAAMHPIATEIFGTEFNLADRWSQRLAGRRFMPTSTHARDDRFSAIRNCIH